MVGAPLSDAGVEIGQHRARAQKVGERSEEQAAGKHESECDRQREAACDLGTEPSLDRVQKPLVVAELVAGRARHCSGGRSGD